MHPSHMHKSSAIKAGLAGVSGIIPALACLRSTSPSAYLQCSVARTRASPPTSASSSTSRRRRTTGTPTPRGKKVVVLARTFSMMTTPCPPSQARPTRRRDATPSLRSRLTLGGRPIGRRDFVVVSRSHRPSLGTCTHYSKNTFISLVFFHIRFFLQCPPSRLSLPPL